MESYLKEYNDLVTRQSRERLDAERKMLENLGKQRKELEDRLEKERKIQNAATTLALMSEKEINEEQMDESMDIIVEAIVDIKDKNIKINDRSR